MSPILAAVFVSLALQWEGARGECPSPESLAPSCFCMNSFDGPMMSCSGVHNAEELLSPIQATAHKDMFTLLIRNSSLLYLPDGLFRNTRFQKIRLLNTELLSLSDSEYAFGGLESTLTEFRATDAHYVAQWRWSQLEKMKKLNLIDVNFIEMGGVGERFPELPELTALGIIQAGLEFVENWAFAALPKLQIFELRNNKLKELSRSMLPRPANHLFVINLSGNEFESLPSDMFTGMPSLTDVHLTNNRFTVLEERTFSWAFSNLQTLFLSENDIRCDCRMRWVVGHRRPFGFRATCHLPENLRGRAVQSLNYKDLWC